MYSICEGQKASRKVKVGNYNSISINSISTWELRFIILIFYRVLYLMTSGLLSGHPSKETNAYNFQDVSKWKDLGPNFLLQIYRDYK